MTNAIAEQHYHHATDGKPGERNAPPCACDTPNAPARPSTLADVLTGRGYTLWDRQYADSYDLRTPAGTVRAVIWRAPDTDVDVTVWAAAPYGPEEVVSLRVRSDAHPALAAAVVRAVIDQAEAALTA